MFPVKGISMARSEPPPNAVTILDVAREAGVSYATVTRGLTDGLLLVLPRAPAAYLESLRRQQFPYMLIDHQGLGDYHHSVGATNFQGAHAATRHLIELGHRRIGFITGALEIGCA